MVDNGGSLGGKQVRKARVRDARNLKMAYKGPRVLSIPQFVEARKLEILSMSKAIKTSRKVCNKRTFQRLPRHLRRRTASYNSLRVPRRLRHRAKLEIKELQLKSKRKNRLFKLVASNRKAEYLRRQTDKRWLETHIWHAKRFHMKNIWGYRLGERTTFKNFRASYRSRKTRTVIHDASYTGVLELVGASASISALLKNYLDPSDIPISSKRYTNGRRLCNTFFYKKLQYPFDLVCPVQLLWRAKSPQENTQSLWIFVHPSSYDTIFKLLSEDENIQTISLNDLRGKLNMFQLSGPTVLETISNALFFCSPEDPNLRSDPASQSAWELLVHARDSSSFPIDSVLGLTVYDPRLWNNKPQTLKATTLSASKQENLNDLLVSWPASLAESGLWDSTIRSELLTKKVSTNGLNARRSKLLIPGSFLPPTPDDARIPIILVRACIWSHFSTSPAPAPHSTYSWNLIVPGGWGVEFWKTLVFNGAREEGLRDSIERHFEAECPYFPNDFPTTPAYNEFIDNKSEELQTIQLKKPPAKRIPYAAYGITEPFKPNISSLTSLEKLQAPDTQSNNRQWLLLGSKNITFFQSILNSDDIVSQTGKYFSDIANKRGVQMSNIPNFAQGITLTKLKMLDKGSELTNAVIYKVDQATYETLSFPKWDAVTMENQSSVGHPTRPPPTDIIGYVTFGHFSMASGKSKGLAICSLSGLLDLHKLDSRYSRSHQSIVLVHPINSPILRLGYIRLA